MTRDRIHSNGHDAEASCHNIYVYCVPTYTYVGINPYKYIIRGYVYSIYLCILYVNEKKYLVRGFRENNYIVIRPSIPSRYKFTQSKSNRKTKISI